LIGFRRWQNGNGSSPLINGRALLPANASALKNSPQWLPHNEARRTLDLFASTFSTMT
jgi:hypothetical protein